jgi:hypothetical protein
METAKALTSLLTIIFAILSGVFWIRAATAKVLAQSEQVGVGYGGNPVNVKDHRGNVLDFLATYALQSKWNGWAAWMSALAAGFGAASLILQRF